MQFSIRTLLLAAFLVALPLGACSIYNNIWLAHSRALEPSLFRMIIQEEFEYGPGIDQLDFDSIDFSSLDFEPLRLDSGAELSKDDTPPASNVDTFEVFLFFSRAGVHVLTPAQEALVNQIGIHYVRTATSDDEHKHHFYIKIIKWIDWDTVIVDYGSVDGPLSGGGADGMILKHKDGKWGVVEYGSYWVS